MFLVVDLSLLVLFKMIGITKIIILFSLKAYIFIFLKSLNALSENLNGEKKS
jgi:hypothetical protein